MSRTATLHNNQSTTVPVSVLQMDTNERHSGTVTVAYPGILFGGGSTNSVEDRENGDLGAVGP